MNRYVVGFISFFDNELKQEIIEANSPEEALVHSKFIGDYEFPANASVDTIQQIMFDCDSAVNVIQV